MEQAKVTTLGVLRFRVNYWLRQRLESIEMSIAYWMPRNIVYWCVVRAWNNAATGKWSHVEVPAVTAVDIVKRWREKR